MTSYFTEDEFLTSAIAALTTTSSDSVLAALGWSDVLPYLDDGDARRAIFALFRAQGRTLVTTAALGLLMGQAYAEFDVTDDVPLAINRNSPTRGGSLLVLGPVPDRVLVDRPGFGVSVVSPRPEQVRPIDIPGRIDVAELMIDDGQLSVAVPEQHLKAPRRRALYMGRVAVAFDILGAAEQSVTVAVDYAKEREQFGRPIGTFQAVRHGLASALIDCEALLGMAQQVVELGPALPAKFDVVLKALAGRNGLRACQHSLQTLGGVGFTTEHSHHHLYSRVLGLNALLGTTADLTNELAFDALRDADEIQHLSLTAVHQVG